MLFSLWKGRHPPSRERPGMLNKFCKITSATVLALAAGWLVFTVAYSQIGSIFVSWFMAIIVIGFACIAIGSIAKYIKSLPEKYRKMETGISYQRTQPPSA